MSYWAKKLEELLTVEREKERIEMEKMISREQALAEIEAANDEVYKDEFIEIIQSFYPADSKFPKTQEIGRRLLDQAKNEIENKTWRDLPAAVLKRYAELCEDRGAAEDYASYVSSRETYND